MLFTTSLRPATTHSLRARVTKKCTELLETLKKTGSTGQMADQMLSHKELWAMFDHEKWVAIENKYIVR